MERTYDAGTAQRAAELEDILTSVRKFFVRRKRNLVKVSGIPDEEHAVTLDGIVKKTMNALEGDDFDGWSEYAHGFIAGAVAGGYSLAGNLMREIKEKTGLKFQVSDDMPDAGEEGE